MRVRLGLGVLGLMLLGAAAASAQSAPPTARDRVLGLLRAIDQVPPPEAFTALGTEGRDALLALAADRAETPFLRGRAVAALGHFPDDTVRVAVEGLLDEPDLSDMILRRVLGTLAVFGDRETSRVSPYLDDGRPDVREEAARSLGRIGSDAALRALRRRLGRETADPVRELLDGEIRRLEGLRAPG